ncbi:hypothetical protein [Psychroserpens mesophilus]|uniref:hypothetical protein n=1 Tax=Psychroserpens mesophilus TaxID=325473 RepID=UPI003D6565EE
MKQDIRDLFTNEEGSGSQLPEHHRQEFYDKLKASRPKRKSSLSRNYLLKMAAVILLFLALTFVINTTTDKVSNQIADESVMETQINAIEKQYLTNIDDEWQNFIRITDDDTLVKRYKQKLDDLDKDYKEISNQFKADQNNILVVEALVDNLKTRLQLLKDIQEHIKVLNQKNEHYETISI